MDRLILPRWAIEKLRVLEAEFPGMKFQAESEPDTDNLGLLCGLKVTERTSWGLSDTIVLRGPAAVDEEGAPAGPDEVEIKISSPTRMDLGDWFKDGTEYTLAFGPEEALDVGRPTGVIIPHMEVAEKTRWGLSVTTRLQADVGRGKVVEVKVCLPWPDEQSPKGLMEEGQIYTVAIEPVNAQGVPEEADPSGEQPYREQGQPPTLGGTLGKELTLKHFDEALQVPNFQDRIKEAVRRAREYAQLNPVYQTGWVDGRLWDDCIGDQTKVEWVEGGKWGDEEDLARIEREAAPLDGPVALTLGEHMRERALHYEEEGDLKGAALYRESARRLLARRLLWKYIGGQTWEVSCANDE